jgi:hypothetical protein
MLKATIHEPPAPARVESERRLKIPDDSMLASRAGAVVIVSTPALLVAEAGRYVRSNVSACRRTDEW